MLLKIYFVFHISSTVSLYVSMYLCVNDEYDEWVRISYIFFTGMYASSIPEFDTANILHDLKNKM